MYLKCHYLHVEKMTRNKTQSHEPATLERLFGSTATIRILDQLTLFNEDDFSKADISRNSDISFQHALKEISKLEEKSLIKKTRNVGNAQMYKLNTDNPAGQLLLKLKNELMSQEAQKIAEQEITNTTQDTTRIEMALKQMDIEPTQ